MGIWGMAVHKVKSVAARAKSRAASLVATLKIKGEVSSAQESLKAQYTVLGAKYYSLHAQNPDPALESICAAIDGINSQIEAWEREIATLGSIGECPQCAAKIQKGSVFCEVCGLRLSGAQPSQSRLCPSCGGQVSPDAMFCKSCGSKLPHGLGGTVLGQPAEVEESGQEQFEPEDQEAVQGQKSGIVSAFSKLIS